MVTRFLRSDATATIFFSCCLFCAASIQGRRFYPWKSHRLASFQGPTQLSVAISTVKWERAWYFFSREWRQDRKDGRKGLIMRGCTRPRTAKRANVVGNLQHVSSYRRAIVVYTEHWACSQLRNTRNAACLFWNFSPFYDYVMLTWEKIPGSPRFSVLQATKPWAGLGSRLPTDINDGSIRHVWAIQWQLLDAVCSTHSLSVLLSAAEMSHTTRTALALAWWPSSEIICTCHVHELRLLLRAAFITLRASNCAATIQGWRLFKEIRYFSSKTQIHEKTAKRVHGSCKYWTDCCLDTSCMG